MLTSEIQAQFAFQRRDVSRKYVVIGEGILWRALIQVRTAQVLVNVLAAKYKISCKWDCILHTEWNTGKTKKNSIWSLYDE
jgi:hypothetical protein